MISNVLAINKKGLSHERCEDSIYVDNINRVYVVCDGVSNSVYGGEGAKALCTFIAEKLSHENSKQYLAHESVQDIRKAMVDLIKQCTELSTQKLACKPNDIASTLIVISVYDDIATIIHAGDGAVFAAPEVYEDETPLLISYPDNDAKQRVFPAASPLQLERMRVLRLNTNDLKCIAFGTDGFTDKYLRPHTSGFDGYGLHEVFKINNDEEFEELVKNKHLKRPAITDDISAVIIKFDNGIEYTGKPQSEPVPTQTNTENKIVIKETNKEPDDASKEVELNDSIDGNNTEINAESKAPKMILMILSILVIFSMIAVCVFGYNMKSANQGYDKQFSILSEQVSSLQERVSELEKVELTTEEITLEDDNVSDNDEENTSEITENDFEDADNTNRQESTTNSNTTSQSSTTENNARY